MPNIKNKELRFKILNECLRDSCKLYTYQTLLAALNRQLAMVDESLQISERTLKDDIENMKYEYGIELDKDLAKKRPVILRYADLSDSIYKLSMEEANALRKTVDMLLQYPGVHPIQYDYIKVCLQQILKNDCLDIDNPAVSFADNMEHKGREFFEILCRYIMDRQTISLKYQPFDMEAMDIVLYPYILKQYNERWFMIAGGLEMRGLMVFALDRIVSVSDSNAPYKQCDIDLNEYFDEIVGVTKYNDAKLENVLLKVNSKRYHYIETKPIVPSQKLIHNMSTEDKKIIKLQARVNNELIALIMSFGEDMEVMEPLWLRKKIAEKANTLHRLYGE